MPKLLRNRPLLFVFIVLSVLVPRAWADGGTAGVPMDGLLCWLDAGDKDTLQLNADKVAGWRNKAPGASDTFIAEEGRQAQYDPRPGSGVRPVLRFDGYNDVLRDLAFGRQAEQWTLAVVAAPYKGGGGVCSACPRDGHDYDPGFTFDLFQSGARFEQLSVEGAGRIGGAQDQLQRDFAYGGLHVMIVERDNTEIRLFVDGVQEAARSVNPATTIMDELRIGARHYAGRECAFFKGEIATVLLYGRMLSAPERSTLEATLSVPPEECGKGERLLVELNKEAVAHRMVAPRLLHAWPSIPAFESAQAATPGFKSVAALPIRDDLAEAIRLCVRHLNNLYDADRDQEPFFYSNLRVDGTGEMHHSVEIGIPHVVGRCLVGCMTAELYAGIPFPADGLAILERYLKSSFDNPNHLNSYYDPKQDNKRCIEFHNMREGLFGLWALTAGRHSAWARETAHAMLETLDKMTDDQGHWSLGRAKALGMEGICFGVTIPNATRMVDPLLAFYRATGDELALKLAGLYARAGLRELFEEDGRFAPMERSSGHVHSITSSLSGITDYAMVSKDDAMLAACRRIMNHGVPDYFSSWGWGDEVFPEHPANEVSRGEINQTGDVIRTALLLGDAGYPEYYETAERFLRGMLLPTQHREDELRGYMRENEHPASDAERDVLQRTIGGYAMQLPNDRMREGDWPLSTLDITSGAVHALSECWRHRVTTRENGCFVNLLFSAETEDVHIESGLPKAGSLRFVMKTAKPLAIRIPRWVDTASLTVQLNGTKRVWEVEEGFLRLGALQPGDEGRIGFDVPCKEESEVVDGITYTTTWVGTQLIGVSPRGTVSPLPF